ncbi:MAG TPA: hypothetical protein VFM11_11665, partial [Burkholderiales bacterium]|nr:hypothetical protein [Burkholderiales bacterium]
MMMGLIYCEGRKSKSDNRQGAKNAEEKQRKAITAKARRRKEKPQRTSTWFSFASLCAFAPLRLQSFCDSIFLGALGALAVMLFSSSRHGLVQRRQELIRRLEADH